MSRHHVVAEMPAWLMPEAWQADALCAEYRDRAEDWFPARGEPLEPARRVCQRCAVRVECLAFALDHHILDGVWGGASGAERRRMWQQGWTGALLVALGEHVT